MIDAFNFRADLFVEFVLRIQVAQNLNGCLKRIDACVGNGRMGHLAVNSDFHLQASIVCCDHLVAKAGCNHEVGACMPFVE